jgi:oxaloacetate decarboxylase alpha subunit
MHFHNTTGLAPLNYLIAVDLGIDVLHTASDPVANGVSLPSVEQTLANLEHLGHTTGLDHTMLPAMAEHLVSVARSEGYEIGRPAEYDISTYSHQMPGGATGTLKSQLDQHGLTHRLSETLEEAARVHKELGSPVMATPISQLVSIQALLNVTLGKRYASVPDDVVFYVLGRLGTPPGPIDDNVKDKILGTARARELAAWEQPEPTLDDLRQEHGINLTDEELWLRAVMQRSVIDAMRDHGPASMKWRPSPKSPAAALIEAMGNTVCGDSLSYQSADLTFELRRR